MLHPPSVLLVLLLVLLVLPPLSLVHCQSSYDSSNFLCIDESSGGVKLYTGYKATRDCRGYVYCNDGVSAGVIPCWPNQLYDTVSGVCTYWQNVVNTNANAADCPDLEAGSMMMPEITDANANEQLFYCGASASNARSVCEPCPGGSRLECSDLLHNCFAGITGCNKNADDADAADANIANDVGISSSSIETITNDVESSIITVEPSDDDITFAPSLSPEERSVQEFVTLQTTNPTPHVPDSTEPTLPPLTTTPQVESSQSTTVIMIDQQQLLCASTKDELELTCASSPSCANTPCPSQMFCFAFTCNNNINVAALTTTTTTTTTAESSAVATSSSNNIIIGDGGGGADVVTEEEEDVGTIMLEPNWMRERVTLIIVKRETTNTTINQH